MKAMLIAAVALTPLAACDKPAADTGTTAAAPTATTPGLPAPVASTATPAPAGPSLGQSMDAKEEVKLDVIEATRTGGILTIRTRMTLVAGKSGSRPIPGSATGDSIYVSAADKKYLMLKDDADKALMSNNYYPDFNQIGVSSTWWAKFPAPPPEVKAINFFFNDFTPVENVAITDR